MSSKKTAKRLSLMAGSSLAAAWLLAAAGTVVMAPTAALAANECGDPTGPAADTFNCGGTFASVTYVTDGDLTLGLDDNLNITTGGLSITGDDAASVTIGTMIDGTDFSIVNTIGAAIDINVAGAVSAIIYDSDQAEGLASVSGATHGVRMRSTGAPAYSFVAVDGVNIEGDIGIEVGGSGVGTAFLALGFSGPTVSITGSDTAILLDFDGNTDLFLYENIEIVGGTGAAIRVTGGSGAINIVDGGFPRGGKILGRLDIGSTGGTTFNNSNEWRTSGANRISAGASTVTNSGLLATNVDAAATSIDFGTGGSLTNTGTLAVGVGTEGAATLAITDLDSWSNSSKILFGVNGDLTGSDGVANDRISAPGANFEGELNTANRPVGALYMDTNFAAQGDCSAAVGADCLDLDGGSTSGQTFIVLRRAGSSQGGTAPIVLVDVGSGTGAQGDFVLSEFSDGYRQGQEGAPNTVEAGLFRYALRYEDGQHALVGIPDGEIAEFGLVGDAALVAWDTATTSAFQRQADLRDAIGDNAPERAPGAWLRASSNKIDYTLLQQYESFDSSFTYNTAYSQKSQSLVGGIDLLNTLDAGSGFVVGVTAGKTTSELDFRASLTTVDLDGHSLGAYASLYGANYFLDAIVNTSKLDLEYAGSGLTESGEVESFGVQVEGGFRIGMAEGWAFFEPLVSLSHVTTEISDLDLAGVVVEFDESTTTRGALGARVGGRMAFDGMTATISGTGRVWQEFEGEDRLTMLSNGPAADYATDTGDTMGDVGASLGLFANDLGFSAGVDVSHKFKQNYSSTDLSVYLRYWF